MADVKHGFGPGASDPAIVFQRFQHLRRCRTHSLDKRFSIFLGTDCHDAPAFPNQFGGAASTAAHDRQPAGHGLDDDVGTRIAQTWMDQHMDAGCD